MRAIRTRRCADAAAALSRTLPGTAPARLQRQLELARDVRAIRFRARLRRAAGVDDAIELDDRPPLEADRPERGDAALHVDAPASELDPLIAGRGLDRAHVLQVHHLDRLAVATDRVHRIAAALL